MFRMLPEYTRTKIMTRAYIRFVISPAWCGGEPTNIINIPHRVEYFPYENSSESLHLYDTYMTINKSYIKMSRVRPSKLLEDTIVEDADEEDRAVRYFLFERTIEKLINMGKVAGVGAVFVGTGIPFADEVLVDKGFSLKRSEFKKSNIKGRKKL